MSIQSINHVQLAFPAGAAPQPARVTGKAVAIRRDATSETGRFIQTPLVYAGYELPGSKRTRAERPVVKRTLSKKSCEYLPLTA